MCTLPNITGIIICLVFSKFWVMICKMYPWFLNRQFFFPLSVSLISLSTEETHKRHKLLELQHPLGLCLQSCVLLAYTSTVLTSLFLASKKEHCCTSQKWTLICDFKNSLIVKHGKDNCDGYRDHHCCSGKRDWAQLQICHKKVGIYSPRVGLGQGSVDRKLLERKHKGKEASG